MGGKIIHFRVRRQGSGGTPLTCCLGGDEDTITDAQANTQGHESKLESPPKVAITVFICEKLIELATPHQSKSKLGEERLDQTVFRGQPATRGGAQGEAGAAIRFSKNHQESREPAVLLSLWFYLRFPYSMSGFGTRYWHFPDTGSAGNRTRLAHLPVSGNSDTAQIYRVVSLFDGCNLRMRAAPFFVRVPVVRTRAGFCV